MLDEEREPEVNDSEDEIHDESLSEYFSDVYIDDAQIRIEYDSDRKNILLVEDDEYVAKEYGQMLGAYGFNVSYAFDGEQAIKLIFEYGEYFHAVVLDLRMHSGRFLSPSDTGNGLRTGLVLSQDYSQYCLQAEIFGLSNSTYALDGAWFSARERHHFCSKKDYPADIFARFVHLTCIESDGVTGENDIGREASHWEEQISRLAGQKSSVTIQIIKEQTVGDKYVANQVGAQGKHATASNMTFNQIWESKKADLDLTELARQLTQLREGMATRAGTQNEYIEIGHVAAAEQDAVSGNGPKALESLQKTGKWTLDIAEKIGVGVAVAAIKSVIGF